jgi:hypothetical protein
MPRTDMWRSTQVVGALCLGAGLTVCGSSSAIARALPSCTRAFHLQGNASAYPGVANTQLTYAVVLSNPSHQLLAVNVRVMTRLLDASGKVVLSVSDTIPFLPPGTAAAVADADTYTRIGHRYQPLSAARTVSVGCAFGGWYRVTSPLPKLSASHAHTQTINLMDTTATISSGFHRKLYNATLVAVFRDSRGQIIGGSSACVDVVEPGTHSGYDAGELPDPVPGVASTSAYVQWDLPPRGDGPSHLCGEVVSVPRLGARPFPGLIGPLDPAQAASYWP